jgi:hypothetical protein
MFNRKFKPSKFESALYDQDAVMFGEHVQIKAHSMTGSKCNFLDAMEHLDKKWAEQGEP